MWADPAAIEKEIQRVESQSDDVASRDDARSSAVPPFVPLPPGVLPPPPSPGPISREVSDSGVPLKSSVTDTVPASLVKP